MQSKKDFFHSDSNGFQVETVLDSAAHIGEDGYMLNATETTTDLEALTVARDAKLATYQEACKRVARTPADSPLLDLYRDAMHVAEAEYETAEDDLREVRDGYRHTYPHPVCGIHPFDGYRPGRG